MKTKESFWTRLLPESVQRSIVKSWTPFGDGVVDTAYGNGGPTWLTNDNNTFITQGFMGNPTVYMIISYITRLAASIPWVLYEVKDEKALNRYKYMDPLDVFRAPMLERKALQEVNGHQIMDIWERPNELQGRSEFIEQVLGNRLLTGNTYVYGAGPQTGPNTGLYLELEVLPSQLIGIKYGGPANPVAHYYWLGDPSKQIPRDYVMHSKTWNPLPLNQGGLYGLSPLSAGSRLITRNNDSITASVKSLQNMGAVGMLSRYVGTPGEKGLTQDQAELIEKKYAQKYGGANNRGKIMVTGAAVKWQQMAMSPVDLQIIKQEQMDLRYLCGIFGLSSRLFNDPENQTYNNMKEAKAGAYTQAVIPPLRSIRDELNRWWIPGFSKRDNKKYFLDIDTQAIPELQTNFKELIEWLRDADMLTLNEKRAVIDYSNIDAPGMDEIWTDGGKVTLDQAMNDVGPVDKYLDYMNNT